MPSKTRKTSASVQDILSRPISNSADLLNNHEEHEDITVCLLLQLFLHPASVTGVIVLTLFVCLCVSICYHSHGRTDKHADLIFGV